SPIDAEVRAPLGGPLVGRLAVSSYGAEEVPRPGGYLERLQQYQARYRVLRSGAGELEDETPSVATGGEPGGSSIRARLGLPWGADDTGYLGVGGGRDVPAERLYLTEQHAIGRIPIDDLTRDGSGVTGEHILTRLRTYAAAGLYDGGDGNG